MNNLQEITIKVPSEIAESYQQASELEKQKMITRISFFLQPISSDKTIAIKKSRQSMANIGNKAIARGLTPEILEDILHEND